MLKRFILGAILALLALPVHGAGLYPLSNQQLMDSNSKVMPGAKLFLYNGGTTVPRIAYRDLALTAPHPSPILADNAGRLPLIYLADGYYRQRLTTKAGALIFDQDGIPVLTTSAGGAGTTVDPDSVYKTGDFKFSYTDQPVAGYVRANGRTIGSAASGATERANADTQPLYEKLWGFTNITVAGGKGADAPSDFAANKPLVLPNAAGRALVGSDDLGAGAQSVLTSTTCSAPTLPGSPCGAQIITIAATNLPVTSPWLASALTTVSGFVGVGGAHNHIGTTDGGSGTPHNHNYTVRSGLVNINQGGGTATTNLWQGDGGTGTGTENQSLTHTHTFTTTTHTGHDHTWVGSASTSVAIGTNTSGGGTALNKLPPVLTSMIFVRL